MDIPIAKGPSLVHSFTPWFWGRFDSTQNLPLSAADRAELCTCQQSLGYANDDFIRTWEQLFQKCEKPLEETLVNSNNPYKKKERTPMASNSDVNHCTFEEYSTVQIM